MPETNNAEIIQELQGQKYIFLEGDQQYLDEYAHIYNLFRQRYVLLSRLNDDEERPGLRDKRGRERLLELDKTISEKEWLFWEMVDKSRQAGKRFMVEELAEFFKLGHFEKRVLLFMLSSGLLGEKFFEMAAKEVIKALSLTDSLVEKMQNFIYFEDAKPLVGKKLLSRSGLGRYSEYSINPILLEWFSKKLNGEQLPIPEILMQKERREEEKSGFIKDPEHSLEKVVLSDELKERVKFFVEIYRDKRFRELGVSQTIKNSEGLTFLFYGPPGTGKSMLAEAIADHVGKRILVVETPKIFDYFLGETDKNISSMFKSAREKDLVLLIDEADSLVYSRAIASSDFKLRFVNLMLTELERFEGIAILTTNMNDILDSALERRITFKVPFDLPTWEKRVEIWQKQIPPSLPLSTDVDIEILAKRYEFSGGNIKNAILNAIRKTLFRKDKVLIMDDLIFGAELEKKGMFSSQAKKGVLGFVSTT